MSFGADSEASVRHFADQEALITWLESELDPADLVLVKGSR